jgi:hypothetical protein
MWALTVALFSAGPTVSLTGQRMTCKCSVKNSHMVETIIDLGNTPLSAADFTGQVQLTLSLSMSARFI